MSTPHKSHNAAFLALVNDSKSRVKEIDIEGYKKMPREGHLLIDVREDWEVELAPAPTEFVHIPMGQIPDRLGELDPGKETVIICRSATLRATSYAFPGASKLRAWAGFPSRIRRTVTYIRCTCSKFEASPRPDTKSAFCAMWRTTPL